MRIACPRGYWLRRENLPKSGARSSKCMPIWLSWDTTVRTNAWQPWWRAWPGDLRQRELSAIGPRTMDAKTAVDRVGKGKQRDVNARFKAMASQYVFEPEFCNPAAGWEKGQVEKNVQDARNRMWQVMPVFTDLAELNQCLEDRCIALKRPRISAAQGFVLNMRSRWHRMAVGCPEQTWSFG